MNEAVTIERTRAERVYAFLEGFAEYGYRFGLPDDLREFAEGYLQADDTRPSSWGLADDPQPPETLAEILAESGWKAGTFGDAYRTIGPFGLYVYPGEDMQGSKGWSVVVTCRPGRTPQHDVEPAALYAAADLMRRIEAAIAREAGE